MNLKSRAKCPVCQYPGDTNYCPRCGTKREREEDLYCGHCQLAHVSPRHIGTDAARYCYSCGGKADWISLAEMSKRVLGF